MKMWKTLLLSIALILAVNACNDSSPTTPIKSNILNNWTAEIIVDSVLTANLFSVTVDDKSYTVSVADLDVFEIAKNDNLANQALLAEISEDSAMAIGNRAYIFAKELLSHKMILMVRDSLYGNSNSYGQLIRHIFIDGLSYDSLMIANGFAAPRKAHPDDKDFFAKVDWIYDGDTFEYKFEGASQKVRILNIDCYETQINDRLSEQASRNKISIDSALALGLAAKEFAMQTLKNKTVLLRRTGSAPNRDVYDRYLRWVEVDGMKYDSLIKVLGFDAN